ncbi:MAG: alpha/beta hydrolase [Treponema sp.]|nr:alpha/beta hydrolase [Treponema sp.]
MPEKASKEKMIIEKIDPVFYLDQNVTYAQTDAWYGHVTRDLKMDIIYPQTDEKKYPCIIWVCGGAWMQMDKGAHLPYLTELARSGFTVASAEYRLGHEAPFPSALVDIKAAVRYLRANAKRYSIDIKKFGICGESAGGYLASMAALTNGKDFEQGGHLDQSSALQAACPWYTPCDLPKLAKEKSFRPPFFAGDINDDQYCRFINPLSYITSKAPPFLLIHGDLDETVPLDQSETFYEALIAKKIDARLIILEGAGHADAQFFQSPLWEIIIKFFKEKLK